MKKNLENTNKEGTASGRFNCKQNDTILNWFKLKAANSNISHLWQKTLSKKEKMLANQHFLLFPQCFQKHFCFTIVKSRNCLVEIDEK